MEYNVSKLIDLLEDDPKILSYKIRDQSLWMILRQVMIQFILNNSLTEVKKPNRSIIKLLNTLNALFHSVIFPPQKIKKGKVLFIANSLKETNEGYINHITDPLFSYIKRDSYVFYEGKNTIKKQFSCLERSLFWTELKINFRSKWKSLKKEELVILKKFLMFFNDKLKENNISYIIISETFLIKRINLYFLKYNDYKDILRIIKPKLIMAEGLCYSRSYITLAAKELSIKTGELQHGSIDQSSYPYNVGAGLAYQKSIRAYYPNYFFSFGAYWQSFMNIPSESIPIGFSFLEGYSRKENTLSKTKTILVISSSLNSKEIIRYTLELNKLAKTRKVKIIFRPSPRELPNLKEVYGRLMSKENIDIDANLSIYDSFLNCNTVVGDYSTVLFEAINFNKSIYLFNTKSTRMFYTKLFLKLEMNQLETVFESNFESFSKIKQEIWCPNPDKKLASFISKSL